ncbi:hypothetical protein [Micromonospora carbonacea]|uniref:hypothetical protein n=1 Tax=Micromonospora carbonacea TaxID=47853 RepID=UPI0037172CFB
MSTGGKERQPVYFRASKPAIGILEQLAHDEGVLDRHGNPNRSEMIRILLAYALRHWKRGWRP